MMDYGKVPCLPHGLLQDGQEIKGPLGFTGLVRWARQAPPFPFPTGYFIQGSPPAPEASIITLPLRSPTSILSPFNATYILSSRRQLRSQPNHQSCQPAATKTKANPKRRATRVTSPPSGSLQTLLTQTLSSIVSSSLVRASNGEFSRHGSRNYVVPRHYAPRAL